jgi:hypothetical protein
MRFFMGFSTGEPGKGFGENGEERLVTQSPIGGSPS